MMLALSYADRCRCMLFCNARDRCLSVDARLFLVRQEAASADRLTVVQLAGNCNSILNFHPPPCAFMEVSPFVDARGLETLPVPVFGLDL